MQEAMQGIKINAEMTTGGESILTPEAVAFLAGLHRKFESTRQQRLRDRVAVQQNLDKGGKLDFPPETASLRSSAWKVAPIPADLQDRRGGSTGAGDRKMIIKAPHL